MPKGANVTGFEMKKFIDAAHPNSSYARADPWKRAEAWRYTGPFTRWNRFKAATPGLGIATVAFAAYCAYEAVFMKDDHHGHGEGHGEGHH